MMKKYIRKNVPFDPEDEREMQLYEWLQQLPHGYFSELTKKLWKDVMQKNIGVENYINIEKMKEGQK